MRIAQLGGVPPAIGGGGIEVQMARTADALRRQGHTVNPVGELTRDEGFDVLHAFSSSPDVWQYLRHWRVNRTPLVVSPVIVVSPGRGERVLKAGSRVSALANVARMHREVVRAADHAIALTEYERGVVDALSGGTVPITVIDNGGDSAAVGANPIAEDQRPYVVLLGTVSARKRQAEIVRELGAAARFAVVGGFDGSAAERQAFASQVESAGSIWLGEVADPAVVAAIVAGGTALVQFSESEVQSLAVMEALAVGTPIVASDIPSHRELAARWPGWVTPVDSLGAAGRRIAELLNAPPPGPAPDPPTWDDAATKLVEVYAHTLRNAAPAASA